MRAVLAPVLLWACLAAGAAEAQDAATETPDTPFDLSSPRASFAVRYEAAGEPRIRGVAKTSVERRLSDEGLKGSMGFMCGLQPGAETRGGLAMRGYDPSGRFVGARLSLKFR